MIQVNKKVMKVNEFPAHKTRINCAMIGPKSGQTVATGGDDKVVNIWNMFNSTGSGDSPQAPIFRLHGHSSAVQCVAFDKVEESIIAGSERGSIRLWDLRTASQMDSLAGNTSVNQSIRSFGPGHKASVTCVDFHPFGSYFASGSADTNVKVWDIRARTCLQTYKGHESAITSLKFTPDGRMLVAGSANGSIKVWDLTSAREINLQVDPAVSHKKAVTNLQFHPVELLLTTGSEDKTVKFWELDEKGIYYVSSTELTSSAPRALSFIGCDTSGEYMMPDDASRMHLLCAANDGIRVYSDWDKRGDDLQALNSVNVKWTGLCDMKVMTTRGSKTPGIFGISTHNTSQFGYLSVWVVVASKLSERSASQQSRDGESSPATDYSDFPVQAKREPRRPNMPLNQSLTSDVLNEVRSEFVSISEPVSTNNRETRTPTPVITSKISSPSPLVELTPLDEPDTPTEELPVKPFRPKDGQSQIDSDGIVPAKRDRPIGLKADEFVVHQDVSDLPDSQLISQLIGSHEKMCSVMQARLTNMKLIERLWTQNSRDVKEAMKLVVNQFGKHKDHALAVDVLRIVMKPDYVKKFLNLEICVMLLPLAKELCSTRFEEYITVALLTATQLFNSFNQIITQTLRNFKDSPTIVDLNAEDRKDKCEKCQALFVAIRQIAERKFNHRVDDIGTHARVYVRTLGSFGTERNK